MHFKPPQEAHDTSSAPMDVDPQLQLTFANMDARLLLSCIESAAAADPYPSFREEPPAHRTQSHHLPPEPPSKKIPPPSTLRRLLNPIEACHAYATGSFEPLDTLYMDQEAQHNSFPVDQRGALRLAQTLYLDIHLKHTFSLSQLAARDICMVEPFIRDYYINVRDMMVEEATISILSQLLHPSL